MLTRSIWVRRLIPADQAAYDAATAAGLLYTGEWKTNPGGEIGEAVTDYIAPQQVDPANPDSGVVMVPRLGVCWDQKTIPAICYEDPSFLENVDAEVDAEADAAADAADNEEDDEPQEQGQ